MSKYIILSLMLYIVSCSSIYIKMINNSNEEWTEKDYKVMNSVKKRCLFLFKNKPYLKVFIKNRQNDYSAKCGKK